MSIQAMNYVRNLKVGRSSEKFVLLCIANYADEDGFAYPSQKRLCDDTEMDRKTVMGAIAALLAGGFIRDSGQRRGATSQVIVYQLIISSEHVNYNGPKNGTASERRSKSPVFPAKESQKRYFEESQKRDTEPSVEPSVESKKVPLAKANGREDAPELFQVVPKPQPPPSREAALKKQVYDRGKEVFGSEAGGIVTNLIKAKDGKLAKVLAMIEDAAEKRDPVPWINAWLWQYGPPGIQIGRQSSAP